MAYVRTVTYTFPYARITDVLESGTDIWMRLVPANKLLAQESSGMLDTGVWVTQEREGTLRVVSYTEWYSLEELNAFGSDPDVRHHEAAISEATVDGKPEITVYETMG